MENNNPNEYYDNQLYLSIKNNILIDIDYYNEDVGLIFDTEYHNINGKLLDANSIYKFLLQIILLNYSYSIKKRKACPYLNLFYKENKKRYQYLLQYYIKIIDDITITKKLNFKNPVIPINFYEIIFLTLFNKNLFLPHIKRNLEKKYKSNMENITWSSYVKIQEHDKKNNTYTLTLKNPNLVIYPKCRITIHAPVENLVTHLKLEYILTYSGPAGFNNIKQADLITYLQSIKNDRNVKQTSVFKSNMSLLFEKERNNIFYSIIDTYISPHMLTPELSDQFINTFLKLTKEKNLWYLINE